MEWEGREESENVEDRRGMGPAAKAGVAVGGGGILLVILALVLGVDPSVLMGPGQGGDGGGNGAPQQKREFTAEEQRQAKFTKVIFRDTEVVWEKIFADQLGKNYKKPTLVLFTEVVESACGTADSAVGPFYCPGDEKVYIDLSFYTAMEKELKAPGEFSRAYVIAHEVGHHVQRLLGYSERVDDARRRRVPQEEQNRLSVRLELQADFLAGVWAHHANEIRGLNLTDRDIDLAIKAAEAIGDDTLQKRGRGRVRPEKFTHGSAKQRMAWLKYGLKTGAVKEAKQLFELPYKQLMPPNY
jgi:predicted metalloprotease